MTKKERLKIITELIESTEIGTQEDLTAILISKGLDVSQSTISRDIKELNLIKVQGETIKSKYAKSFDKNDNIPDNIITLFKQIVTSIDIANNLIVIKTLVGNGGAAGMAVDKMNLPGILGTISGDDTMLIISKTNVDAERLLKTLRTL